MGAILKKIGGWLVKLVIPIALAELKKWWDERQKRLAIEKQEAERRKKLEGAESEEEREDSASGSLDDL